MKNTPTPIKKISIILDSKIRIIGLVVLRKRYPKLKAELRKLMVLPNPEYAEAKKYQRSVRNVPKHILLWEHDKEKDMLSLPRGFLQDFLHLLKKHNVEFKIAKDKRVSLENHAKFNSSIELREYQTPAVKAMVKTDSGVLVAPAGCGKTVIGMEIIARLQQPALWLTHTQELAEQATTTAVKFLGMNRKRIGMIGAGQERLGAYLTIGIIQTLTKRDLSVIAHKFGTVIVDETHHGSAPTWQTVVNQLPAKHRYGITATPDRADGLKVITDRVIGPVVYTIPREDVYAAGGTITPHLEVIYTDCQLKDVKRLRKNVTWAGKSGFRKPTIPFHLIISEILNDEQRNLLITETITREAPGHYSLVLSERVAHCEHLAKLLHTKAPQLRIATMHGGVSKKQRYDILEQMNNGNLDILLAVDIAKEGLDIPRLDRLHIIGGGRAENETEQKAGRIQRPFPGKKDAIIFDYVDEKIPSLKSQFQARCHVYKQLGITQMRIAQKGEIY